MSLDCKQGLKYGCHYLEGCISDETDNLILTTPTNPHLIYVRSKDWSDTTKTWIFDETIYSCQPRSYRRARNMDIATEKTFFGRDTNEVKRKTLENVQKMISKLIAPTRQD